MITKELPISVRDEIEDVLDNFDFVVVHKVMQALEWSWFDAVDDVPSISEIRKKARELLIDAGQCVLKSNELYADANRATGGLRAEAYKGDGKTYFKLAFELTSWDNYE